MSFSFSGFKSSSGNTLLQEFIRDLFLLALTGLLIRRAITLDRLTHSSAFYPFPTDFLETFSPIQKCGYIIRNVIRFHSLLLHSIF